MHFLQTLKDTKLMEALSERAFFDLPSELDLFDIRIDDFGAQRLREPVDRLIDLLHLPSQIARGTGESDDPKDGAVPKTGIVELGDGDIEVVAELVFERPHDLTAVLQRLGVRNGDFHG